MDRVLSYYCGQGTLLGADGYQDGKNIDLVIKQLIVEAVQTKGSRLTGISVTAAVQHQEESLTFIDAQ